MPQPLFSVVVPAFNEALYLPRLLDSIDDARIRFNAGPDDVEVIVGNNGSTDDTAGIARARGCKVVDIERRAISSARNGGASAATGKIICFIDADLRVHPDTFIAVNARMSEGKHAGGATGWKLERMSLGLLITTSIVRFLTWIGGVNGGMVFCRADIFGEIGGYNENKRFAEDVEFFRAIRCVGKAHGLGVISGTGTPAIVSTRKFDRHGDWHMLYMWVWVVRNRSLKKTVEHYWYDAGKRF